MIFNKNIDEKAFFHLLLALLFTVVLSSCHTWVYSSLQPDYQRMYVGASYNSIVNSLGMPTRTAPDGAGGSILAYEKSTYDSVQMAYNYNSFTGTYTPESRTTENTSYVYFYMNAQNKCYNVQTNHPKRESKYSKGKTAGLVCAIVGPIALLATLVGILAATN